jgi:hypothetical protein
MRPGAGRLIPAAALAAGTLIALLAAPHAWYLTLGPLCLFLILLAVPVFQNDRWVVLLASGELVVLATALASVWGGWLVQLAVFGLFTFRSDDAGPARAIPEFLLAGAGTLAVVLILEPANHVMVPFLAILGILATVYAILEISAFRWKRALAGGRA